MWINRSLAKQRIIKRSLLFLLSAMFIFSAAAQDFIVTGKIIDSVSAEPISSATIMVSSEKNLSSNILGLSSSKGIFEIKGLSSGTYFLTVTYQTRNILTKR